MLVTVIITVSGRPWESSFIKSEYKKYQCWYTTLNQSEMNVKD